MTAAVPSQSSAPHAAASRRFCTFVVAGRSFAVDAAAVTEVFRGPPTTPVPRAPEAIRGLLNLRGRIVPAIDMRRRLGFEADQRVGDGIHVVLVSGGEAYSLIVDALADVADIPAGAIERPVAASEMVGRDCVEGVYAARDGLVHLLGVEAIIAGLGDTAADRKMR